MIDAHINETGRVSIPPVMGAVPGEGIYALALILALTLFPLLASAPMADMILSDETSRKLSGANRRMKR